MGLNLKWEENVRANVHTELFSFPPNLKHPTALERGAAGDTEVEQAKPRLLTKFAKCSANQ